MERSAYWYVKLEVTWLSNSSYLPILGKTSIPVEKIYSEEQFDEWLPLYYKNEMTGEIKVITKADAGMVVPANKDKEKKKEKKKEHIGIVEEDISLENPEDEEVFIGQNDRLQEIRRLSGITKLKRTENLNQRFMDQFHDLVDTVKAPLRLIQSNNGALRQLYSKYFTSTTNEQRELIAHKMTLLIDSNTTEGKRLGVKFKEIELSNLDAQRNSIKQSESKIRNNIYNVLSKSFLDTMIEFQDIQTQYKAMHKKTARRLFTLTNPNATEEELEKAEEMEIDVVLQQVVTDERKEKAKEALSYIKSKHQEIIKIEQSLLEIQSLFNELAVLVRSQSEFIDRIQSNVHKTKANVSKGVEELKKARYYQNHRFKITPVHLAKLIK